MPLAERGLDVTAPDIPAEYVERVRERPAVGVDATVRQADMSDLDVEGRSTWS